MANLESDMQSKTQKIRELLDDNVLTDEEIEEVLSLVDEIADGLCRMDQDVLSDLSKYPTWIKSNVQNVMYDDKIYEIEQLLDEIDDVVSKET